LDVDHIEDGPRTAAKSTDNITLKHEASVRRPVADLILACADLLPVALMLVLVMAQNASAMNQRESGAVSCYPALSFSQFSLHLPTFSAPASSTTHHATLPFLLSSRQTRSRCFHEPYYLDYPLNGLIHLPLDCTLMYTALQVRT
jgi:hypothetical protein